MSWVSGRARWFGWGVLGGGLLVLAGFLTVPEGVTDLSASTGRWMFVGRSCALVGTYLALVGLLLAARVPWLDRAVGHDHMLRLHAKLGRIAVLLIIVHVLAITVAYADGDSLLGQTWTFLIDYPWMMSAGLAFVFLSGAALASLARFRVRLRYEAWWQFHLYFYLAIALAFGHQLADGVVFVQSPVFRFAWVALYVTVFAALITFRIAMPAVRSWRTGLRVTELKRHGSGPVSVYMTGRRVSRLGARSGQFFNWRFASAPWQAHPYSLSKSPRDGVLRITVKALGDHSQALSQLTLGSPVMFEGPYGAFTWEHVQTPRVVMIAGGIGITPVRALIEEVPPGVAVHVIYRCACESEFVFADEFRRLGVPVTYVAGPPEDHPLDARGLLGLDPRIGKGDVFVCGPPGMKDVVLRSLDELGVPERRIHVEDFSWAGATP